MPKKITQSSEDIQHGRSHLTGYDNWPPRKDILRHLEDIATLASKLTSGTSILDVGCGDGSITRLIAEKNPTIKVVGMDVEKHPHWKFHKLSNLSFITGSVFNLTKADNSFDTVIIKDVLHHLPHPELAVEELERVAKSRVIVIEANRYNPVSFVRMVKIAKHEHFSIRKLSSMTKRKTTALHHIETHVWPSSLTSIGKVHDSMFHNWRVLKKLRNYNFLVIDL